MTSRLCLRNYLRAAFFRPSRQAVKRGAEVKIVYYKTPANDKAIDAWGFRDHRR